MTQRKLKNFIITTFVLDRPTLTEWGYDVSEATDQQLERLAHYVYLMLDEKFWELYFEIDWPSAVQEALDCINNDDRRERIAVRRVCSESSSF